MTGDDAVLELGTCEQCGNDDATHVLRLCLTCAMSIPDPQANDDDDPVGILTVELDDRDVDTIVRLGDYLARLYLDRED